MKSASTTSGTYQLITPPALKERIGGGEGIDAELARRANTAVDHMRIDFLQRVAATVGEITEQNMLAENSVDSGGDFAAEISPMFSDLEMQAAAFGYSLIGDICASLSRYVEHLEAPEDLAGKVVCAHLDALRSVVGHKIEHDGGHLGRALTESLNELVAKSHR